MGSSVFKDDEIPQAALRTLEAHEVEARAPSYPVRHGEPRDSSHRSDPRPRHPDFAAQIPAKTLPGVSIQNSAAPDGRSTFISHMPFAEEAIDHSVTQLIEQKQELPDFEEGYATWKEHAEQGSAGVFTIPVAQAIEGIEKAFQRQS